jgi:uncharacterized protein YbjT (DUF2867 family)
MQLIVGASGAVGIPTIRHLVQLGQDLRALSSSEASAERLRALGVGEVVVGSYRDDGEIERAMRGVDAVCYIPARFVEDEFKVGKATVDAARDAGVDHFLFCSAFQPQLQGLGHHWQKLLLEEHLVESDLRATVVQPSMFMQNLRIEWPVIMATGEYRRPYSTGSKMSVIDTDDLGEAMAKIMTDSCLQGATYQLAGDGPLSHAEMAEIVSEEIGKPVLAIKRDINDWRVWATERGWTDYAIENYMHMCDHYDKHGYKYANAFTLGAVLGRQPLSYREFIRKFAAEQSTK